MKTASSEASSWFQFSLFFNNFQNETFLISKNIKYQEKMTKLIRAPKIKLSFKLSIVKPPFQFLKSNWRISKKCLNVD